MAIIKSNNNTPFLGSFFNGGKKEIIRDCNTKVEVDDHIKVTGKIEEIKNNTLVANCSNSFIDLHYYEHVDCDYCGYTELKEHEEDDCPCGCN